jgi:AcrR family transcriptional regulator/DNA-binding XRE family transcriptional regulator
VTPKQDHSASSPLEFGRRVRELRTARDLTLRALAARLDVSPATMSAIENGRTGVSAQRIVRLAEELGVPVQRMFGQPDVQTPSPRAAGISDGPAGRGTRLLPADWRSFRPLEMDQALRGALSAFLEFGYHGASMRTIAERAGISVAGLYHYYPSKHDMLVALLDLTMTDLLERSTAARNEGSNPVERFSLLVECLALFHTHRRELGFVGASEMRSLSAGARLSVAAARREMQRMVDDEVEQAVRRGDFRTARPKEAARAVVTLCTALPQWFRLPGPSTAEQVAAQYVDFALDLVRYVPGHDPDPQVQSRVDL